MRAVTSSLKSTTPLDKSKSTGACCEQLFLPCLKHIDLPGLNTCKALLSDVASCGPAWAFFMHGGSEVGHVREQAAQAEHRRHFGAERRHGNLTSRIDTEDLSKRVAHRLDGGPRVRGPCRAHARCCGGMRLLTVGAGLCCKVCARGGGALACGGALARGRHDTRRRVKGGDALGPRMALERRDAMQCSVRCCDTEDRSVILDSKRWATSMQIYQPRSPWSSASKHRTLRRPAVVHQLTQLMKIADPSRRAPSSPDLRDDAAHH